MSTTAHTYDTGLRNRRALINKIALALSQGDAEAALSGTERLLRYVASRVGQSSVTA